MAKIPVRGLFPALQVPFDDSLKLLDDEFLAYAANFGRVPGVGGVVVSGHAGEIASLSTEERRRVIELARTALPADKLVVAGIMDPSIPGSIEQLKAAEDAGADAALVLPPFDYLPRRRLTKTSEAPYRYFAGIAEEVDLPFVVFEYPASSGMSYTTETLVRLSEIDNVVAVKDTILNDQLYLEHVEVLSGKIAVLTAFDSPALMGYMLLGCDGLMVGASALAPEAWGAYVDHVLEQDVAAALAIYRSTLLPIVTHIYSGRHETLAHNARMKEALVQTGSFSTARVRPPEVDVTEADKAAVRHGLELAGLLT